MKNNLLNIKHVYVYDFLIFKIKNVHAQKKYTKVKKNIGYAVLDTQLYIFRQEKFFWDILVIFFFCSHYIIIHLPLDLDGTFVMHAL